MEPPEEQPPANRQGNQPTDPNQMELFKEWLHNERENIEIKREELALKNSQLDRAHSYNMAVLEAQRKFIEGEQSNAPRREWHRMIFAGACLLMVLLFLGLLTFWDKDQVTKDLIALLATLFGGGGIGAVWGTLRKNQRQSEDSGSSDKKDE